jgi:hypothetical protein
VYIVSTKLELFERLNKYNSLLPPTNKGSNENKEKLIGFLQDYIFS